MPKTGKTTEWIPPEIDDDKVYRQCGKCGEIIEDLSRLAGLHKSCPKCGQSSETTNACTPPAKAGTTPPEPNVFLPSFVCQKCGEKTNGAAVRINGKWEYLHKCQTSKQTNLTATKIGESVPLTKRDEARAKPSSPKTGKALFVVIGFFILFTPMILDAWGIVYIHFIVQILIGFPVLLSLGLVEEWYEGVKKPHKKVDATVMIGGLAVFLGIFFVLLAVGVKKHKPHKPDDYAVSDREKTLAAINHRDSGPSSQSSRTSSQFSSWDGSHRKLVEAVKRDLHDPGSFSHVETAYDADAKDGHLYVVMDYRAKNKLGAVVLERAGATIEPRTGEILLGPLLLPRNMPMK